MDADACPVKEVLDRAALRHGVTVLYVTATAMRERDASGTRVVRIEAGPDAVDEWIIQQVHPGDLVITQDIPLASAAVARGARVIENRGQEFTAANIADRLATRDLLMSLRDAGAPIGGPKTFTRLDRQKFAQTLGRILDQLRQKTDSV